MFASMQGARAPVFRSAMAAAALCSLLALSACGGGSGGGDAPAARPSSNGSADVYVGNWLSNCIASAPGGGRIRSVITKTAAQKLNVASQVLVYGNTACGGDVLKAVDNGFEVFTLNGSKTVDGKTVDKVIISGSSGDVKLLAYTDGSTILLGDDDSASDLEGYPTALDTSYVLTRQ
jgi:hypothetical protein